MSGIAFSPPSVVGPSIVDSRLEPLTPSCFLVRCRMVGARMLRRHFKHVTVSTTFDFPKAGATDFADPNHDNEKHQNIHDYQPEVPTLKVPR